jgi:non-heme chloroperoxidase
VTHIAENRSTFYWDVAAGAFYGFNRPGAKVSLPIIQNWWRQGMTGGAKPHYDGIKAFSETDQTEDLKNITGPTKGAKLKISPGYPHGMLTVHPDEINADILEFIKG